MLLAWCHPRRSGKSFFRLTCKHATLHFFARFISSRPDLTAPGSPRMAWCAWHSNSPSREFVTQWYVCIGAKNQVGLWWGPWSKQTIDSPWISTGFSEMTNSLETKTCFIRRAVWALHLPWLPLGQGETQLCRWPRLYIGKECLDINFEAENKTFAMPS